LKDAVKRPEAESAGESENFNELLGQPDDRKLTDEAKSPVFFETPESVSLSLGERDAGGFSDAVGVHNAVGVWLSVAVGAEGPVADS
jgi:hypothetical protein